MKVQENLIRFVLNPLGRLMEKLPGKLKTALFYFGGAVLFFLYFFNASTYRFSRYLVVFAGGCLAVGIMVLSTIPGSFRRIKPDRLLSNCWFAAGAFMLISGILYNSDNFSDAIMFLVVYPLVWYVWCQKPISEIFRLLSRLCIHSFEVFLLVSAMFFPVHQAQYPGLMNNVNEAAAYLSLVFAVLMVELLETPGYTLRYWGNLALSGVATTLVFYTNSRTGQLACIVVFVVVTGLHLYNNRPCWGKIVLRRVLPVAISFLIFLPTTVYGLQGIRWVEQKATQTITQWIQVEDPDFPEENISEDDPDFPEENISEDDPQTHGVQGFFEKNEGKTSFDGKNLNQISTGRLEIWRVFAGHVRLFGTDEEVRFFVPSRNDYYVTSHNTPLEFAVYSGIFCGILYFLFNLLAGLKAMGYAVKQTKENGYKLLPIAVTMAFGVCSMLGSLKTPFTYMITVYYFFVQAPLVFSVKPEQQAENAK